MEENRVDEVIASLSKIEKSAEGIKSDTERQKSEYAREIENRIKEFNEKLETEHRENVKRLTERLEKEKTEAMAAMRTEMSAEVGKLEEFYEKNHERIAREVFLQMINE